MQNLNVLRLNHSSCKKVPEKNLRELFLSYVDKELPQDFYDVESAHANKPRSSIHPLSLDEDGNTPFHSACFFGKGKYVETLGSDESILKAQNKHKDSPLHFLARSGNAALYRKIYKNGLFQKHPQLRKDLLLGKNKKGRTPLHEAIISGNTQFALELFKSCTSSQEKKALLKSQDNSLNTPLHLCAYFNRIDIARHLLDSSSKGYNTIKSVVLFVVDLFNFCFGKRPIVQKLAQFLLQLIGLFFERYEMMLNEDGEFPYFQAIQYGSVEIAELFLKYHKSSDPKIVKNKLGDNPLHCALDNCRLDSLTHLLSDPKTARAQIFSQEDTGLNSFHLAARVNFAAGINLMLSKLSEKNRIEALFTTDELGELPLHEACRSKNFEATKALLSVSDPVRFVMTTRFNQERDSPLFYAIAADEEPLINAIKCKSQALLFMQLQKQNKSGRSGMYFACGLLSEDCFDLLTKELSDHQRKNLLTALDENDWTPLHNAASENPELFFTFIFAISLSYKAHLF